MAVIELYRREQASRTLMCNSHSLKANDRPRRWMRIANHPVMKNSYSCGPRTSRVHHILRGHAGYVQVFARTHLRREDIRRRRRQLTWMRSLTSMRTDPPCVAPARVRDWTRACRCSAVDPPLTGVEYNTAQPQRVWGLRLLRSPRPGDPPGHRIKLWVGGSVGANARVYR